MHSRSISYCFSQNRIIFHSPGVLVVDIATRLILCIVLYLSEMYAWIDVSGERTSFNSISMDKGVLVDVAGNTVNPCDDFALNTCPSNIRIGVKGNFYHQNTNLLYLGMYMGMCRMPQISSIHTSGSNDYHITIVIKPNVSAEQCAQTKCNLSMLFSHLCQYATEEQKQYCVCKAI